jgi:DNA-binding NarL/FixJ family response regulator
LRSPAKDGPGLGTLALIRTSAWKRSFQKFGVEAIVAKPADAATRNTTRMAGYRTDAPKGPVWVRSSTPPVASVAQQRVLKEALQGARAYWGNLPAHTTPSVVVYCSHGEVSEEIAGVVGGLKRVAPQAAIVVLSESASLPLARAALGAGASGLLHAGMPPGQLARGLAVAEEGQVVLPRALLNAAEAEERGPDLSTLTQRQLQSLELVAEGFSNTQIARRLWLSESTVKQHLRAAYKVLGVSNRADAARIFRRSKTLMSKPLRSSLGENVATKRPIRTKARS